MSDGDHLQRERRRHVRKNTPATRVAIRDAYGQTWEGRVLDLSAGGVSVLLQSSPLSSVLEIRPWNSSAWVKVLVKNRRYRQSLCLLGCAFSCPPPRETFEALSGRSG